MPQETRYTARQQTADWIQREVTQTLEMPIYRDARLVPPASGTVTITDNSGTEIVSAAAVTITDGIAVYSIDASLLPSTLSLSSLWYEVWVLVIDGVTYTFTRSAALVRRRIYNPVGQLDLERRYVQLSQWLRDGTRTAQPYLDEAFDTVMARLMEDAKFPYLILGPDKLRGVVSHYAWHLFCMDASSTLGGRFTELAQYHIEQYEAGWARLRFDYDFDEDGLPGADEVGVSAEPVIGTHISPGWYWS